jgi:hypothetical protein
LQISAVMKYAGIYVYWLILKCLVSVAVKIEPEAFRIIAQFLSGR